MDLAGLNCEWASDFGFRAWSLCDGLALRQGVLVRTLVRVGDAPRRTGALQADFWLSVPSAGSISWRERAPREARTVAPHSIAAPASGPHPAQA